MGKRTKPTTEKVKITDLMTGFEVRTHFGYKRTAADEIKNEQVLKKAVQARLNRDVEVVTLETGEIVSIPAVDLLVDAKLQHDLANPSQIDLTKWAKAAGEDTVTQEVKVSGAADLFGDIVNKK